MGHTQLKAKQAFRNLHWVKLSVIVITENIKWEDLMEACVEVWGAAK